MTRPGGLAWFGATLVWVGAAIMSFSGLYGLAVACYISARIGWLLPLVVDLGVAVAAWVWRRGVNPEASRLAGRLTWSLLLLTIVGNGAHLGMESAHITPPWWVAAIVGAIPAAVAGTVAHLLVLLGRSVDATDGINESMLLPEKVQPETPAPSPVEAVPAPSKPKPVSVAQRSDKTSTETKDASRETQDAEARKRAQRNERNRAYRERQRLARDAETAQSVTPSNGHAVLQGTR